MPIRYKFGKNKKKGESKDEIRGSVIAKREHRGALSLHPRLEKKRPIDKMGVVKHELRAKLTKAFEFRKKIVSQFEKQMNQCIFVRIDGIVIKASGTVYKKRQVHTKKNNLHHNSFQSLDTFTSEKNWEKRRYNELQNTVSKRTQQYLNSDKCILSSDSDNEDYQSFNSLEEDAMRLYRDDAGPSKPLKSKKKTVSLKTSSSSLFGMITNPSSSKDTFQSKGRTGSTESFDSCLELEIAEKWTPPPQSPKKVTMTSFLAPFQFNPRRPDDSNNSRKMVR